MDQFPVSEVQEIIQNESVIDIRLGDSAQSIAVDLAVDDPLD